MTQKCIKIPNGFVTINEVDNKFIYNGEEIFMEFHPYLGPSFYTFDEDGYEQFIDDWWEHPEINKEFKDWLKKNKE